MRIKLDRTLCDGFGLCAKHAPEYFSLDDWGYASLVGNGTIPEEDQAAVMGALLDGPGPATMGRGEAPPSRDGTAHSDAVEAPEPNPKTDDNEAISEFVR